MFNSPRPARAIVIKMCAEKAGWGKKLPQGSGLGLAWCYSHAGHVAQAVELSVDANKKIKIHRITAVIDVGPVIDMAGAEAYRGKALPPTRSQPPWGFSFTSKKGRASRKRITTTIPILRMPFAPMATRCLDVQSDNPPTGLGEPAFPALAPALGNAIFAATGERVRSLPLRNLGYSI